MPKYEYKVVPAPKKPGKIKGIKGTDNKFAAELATLMNEYGADGWEYQRTDTLPCEERQGLTGRTTTFQNMLVFRRELVDLSAGAPKPDEAQPAVAEPMLAVPTFRSSTPATPAPTFGAPAEGNAPRIGTAQPAAPVGPTPSVAAQ